MIVCISAVLFVLSTCVSTFQRRCDSNTYLLRYVLSALNILRDSKTMTEEVASAEASCGQRSVTENGSD